MSYEAISNYISTFTLKDAPFIHDYTFSMPTVACVGYVAMVFLLPKYYESRKALSLKTPLALWNLFLTILSVAMFIGILLPTIERVKHGEWLDIICDRKAVDQGTDIFWAWVFTMSKYAELVDTWFLIVRKRQVSLLHWYHHFSVLYYTWLAFYYRVSAGRVFSLVNSLIHCFMYFYYFVSCYGYRPFWGKYLTMGQISQMFLGIGVTTAWSIMQFSDANRCGCTNTTVMLVATFVIYSSYAYLFLQFYFKRHTKGAKEE